MRVNTFFRTATVAGLLSLGTIPAFANVIGANGCVGSFCGGTLDVFSNMPGTLLDSASVSFTALNAQNVALYGGVLRSAVYRNAANTLDFYYQFANGASSIDSVGRLTMTSFVGFTTDVGYRLDDFDGMGQFVAGAQAPLMADRSASGGTVGFSFTGLGGAIDPGEISATVVIRTNALTFAAGSLTTQNGAVYTTPSFSPVPEPGTYALMGAGLIALAAIRRRK